MPRREHLVLCGSQHRLGRGSAVNLVLHGNRKNVTLRVSDISRRLVANLPDTLIDLIEVASYVYAADSAISRGGLSDAQMGARWRRNFRLVIPVRRPDLWSSDAVTSSLIETLSFLSDDDYKFEFQRLTSSTPVTDYFEFPATEDTAFTPDAVVLFSGGLDSLRVGLESPSERVVR